MIVEEKKQNNIGKNFIVSAAITIIIGLVTMVYPLVVGLVYNPVIYGSFTILIYYAAVFSIPIQNGVSPAISRFLAASNPEEEKSLENVGIKLSTVYVVLLCLVFPFLAFFAFNLTVAGFFIILVLIISIIFHYLFRNSLQGKEKYNFLLKVESIAFAVFLVFAVIFGILPGVLDWPILANQYIFCIPIIVYHIVFDCVFIIIRFNDFKTIKFLKFPSITKKILLYALLVGTGSLLGLGLSKIQILVADPFLSDIETGVLSFWNTATAPFSLVSITLSAILVPRISNINKFKEKLANPFINKAFWALSLTLIPLIGLLFLLIAKYPSALDVLTLNKYNTVKYWPIVILLCFQASTSLLNAPIVAYFASFEKKVIFNLASSVVKSTSIIISWIFLVPKIGIYGFAGGLAVGGLVGSTISMIVSLILSKGKIGLQLAFLLPIYGLLTILILVLEKWLLISIIVWSVITIPLVVIGIRSFVKILKEKGYAQRYSSETNITSESNIELEETIS
ncbi:MAG: hypothetical protein ACTSQX_13700 [Candidatus Heimdallarchaeota archaeon]